MRLPYVLSIPIVAICAAASIEATAAPPDRSDQPLIYRAAFEADEDLNYDGWPDRWKRRRGYGYPAYLKIGLAVDRRDRSDPPNRALRVRLNGGAAAVYSPPVKISPLFSYRLRARIRTDGLKHDVAHVSLLFRDETGHTLQTFDSMAVRGTSDWTDVVVGPVTPGDRRTRYAVIVLHVRPSQEHDLRGEAWFDDVELVRLPRMVLRLNSKTHIYRRTDVVRVTCELSGTGPRLPRLLFELFDVDGKRLARVTKELDGEAFDGAGETTDARSRDYAGNSSWDVPIKENGFYTLRVSLREDDTAILMRQVRLAVIDEIPLPASGEFGWSLPRGEAPFTVRELAQLLPHMGIHWVKFPCWFGLEEQRRADDLAWFAERLAAHGQQLVGMLDRPPAELRRRLGGQQPLSIAAVFLEDHVWQSSIDAVMVRLSLKVRWWQLGGDDDFSFVNFPGLAVKIRQLKNRFDQYGQKTRVGVNWKWLSEPPATDDPPWSFLTFREPIPLTPAELATYLDAPHGNNTPRWVVLRPLDRRDYDPAVRIHDLVTRMLTAKVHGADVILVTDPFDATTGLFTPDGQPTEMLLPWRTMAAHLAGTTYVGRLQLPGGSRNEVFERDGKAVMVVWNERPVTERLYLGDRVAATDVWGRRTPVRQVVDEEGRTQQVLAVGEMPVIVSGVDLAVARWRIAFRFDQERLASIFGREQRAGFRFRNSLERGATGRLTFELPQEWNAPYRSLRFKLGPGESQTGELAILLGPAATNGQKKVGIDVDLTAGRRYRFRIFRTLEVGLGDVTSEVTTRIDEHGRLIVEQHLQNDGPDPVSFNCLLFAPGRRRLRQHVFRLQQGRITVRFVLPRGDELVGKRIWVRAEEIGGNRLLNYHIVVQP